MAQNIVGGLFGINQQDIIRQQANAETNAAINFANLRPEQQANYGGYLAGQMLGRGAAGLMGAEDPRLKQAKVIEMAKQQGFDPTTYEGAQAMANFFVQNGEPSLATAVMQKAEEMKQTLATTRRTEQQAAREEQKFKYEDQLRAELSALSPDATDDEVISIVRKYGDPTQILKALETKQAKLAGEGTFGAPGPVGKGGAYRDAEGTIIGAAEMAKQRAGFKGAQELMNELNKITVDDVNAAYSPIGVDWTTKEGWQKKLAGAGTLDAQTKIAVSRLNQVIESLPPGAASDADMKAALSGFPGFGDKEALINWVNRAKEKIQFILDGFSTQFAWKPRAVSSGALTTGQQQQPQTTQGGWRLK